MKPARIYIINPGDDPFALSGDEDIYAVGEWELALVGSSPEKLENETRSRGRWLLLFLRPSTAKLDREAKQMTLVGDSITGFRNDNLLLPSANFAKFVKSWSWEKTEGDDEQKPELKEPSPEVYEDLHANVSDRIRLAVDRHIRPNVSASPDLFFQPSKDPSTPSSGTSPATSEQTTSTPE